jgi:hypothetical protein
MPCACAGNQNRGIAYQLGAEYAKKKKEKKEKKKKDKKEKDKKKKHTKSKKH